MYIVTTYKPTYMQELMSAVKRFISSCMVHVTSVHAMYVSQVSALLAVSAGIPAEAPRSSPNVLYSLGNDADLLLYLEDSVIQLKVRCRGSMHTVTDICGRCPCMW